jgi:hypothetical protein
MSYDIIYSLASLSIVWIRISIHETFSISVTFAGSQLHVSDSAARCGVCGPASADSQRVGNG